MPIRPDACRLRDNMDNVVRVNPHRVGKGYISHVAQILCSCVFYYYVTLKKKKKSFLVVSPPETHLTLALKRTLSPTNDMYASLFVCCLPDVDECGVQTHSCWNDSVCVNLPGGYDCVCAAGPGCGGDCPQEEEEVRRNGEDWRPGFDRCAVCSCKVGRKP